MKNTVEAAEWYRLAADQGNPNAQHFLGKAYEEGRGVPQDYVLAHMWLNLAASNPAPWFELDRHEVLTRLKELTVKMTSEQIAEAQRMVREWKFNVER